jgi:hypothetical protein
MKILFLTIGSIIIGTLIEHSIPISWADWKHVTMITIVAGFIFASIGIILRPFNRKERDSINRMLPFRLFVW